MMTGSELPGPDPATDAGTGKLKRKIGILGVGNSFTMNATRFLPEMLAADSAVTADVGVACIGGCSLDRHVALAKLHEQDPSDPNATVYRYKLNGQILRDDAALREILQDSDWDYITIQQVSSQSHRLESYYPFAGELRDYLERCVPDATILIHETWPHRIDCPRTEQWNLLPGAMYEQLHAAYATVAEELGVAVIPVGTAFEEARKEPLWDYRPPTDFKPEDVSSGKALPDETGSLHLGYYWRQNDMDATAPVLCFDGYHAGLAGEYLGSLVWYEFCFGQDAREVSFKPDGLSAKRAASLREIAHRTLARE